MQHTDADRSTKNPWHRPDFVFFDTALEVTAYAGRGDET